MEDALVQKLKMRYDYKHSVLILVLMEDALVHEQFFSYRLHLQRVLILVLMEDALVLTKNRTARTCQGVS